MRRSLRASVALSALLMAMGTAFAESPRWTRVLSGEPMGSPVPLGNRSVTVTDDRSITCIGRDGAFLWSRRLPGRATPYVSVVAEEFVCAVSLPGLVSLFSADGNALWQTKGASDPVAPPKAGRDGRIFVFYRDAVRCFAINGLQLWKVTLPASFVGPVGETGDGDILVPLEGSRLAIIGPFGALGDIAELPDTAVHFAPLPFGFAVSYANGRIEAWDVRAGRIASAVWALSSTTEISALSATAGTVFAVRQNGAVAALNGTDGATLWTRETNLRFGVGFRVLRDYGQYYVLSPGLACAISDNGAVLWALEIPVNAGIPSLGPDGTVYGVASGWQVNAWTGERRIGALEGSHGSRGYGVLSLAGKTPGWFSHPDPGETGAFFSLVSDSIAFGAGSVTVSGDFAGVDEPQWARRLAGIVRGTTFGLALAPGVRAGFFDTERARAASLLGQLGSSEYRDFLIEQSRYANGETLSLGILYGLAAAGGGSGDVGEAVRRIIRTSGSGNDSVNRAACDTLYALIKYGNDRDARDYAALLVSFTKSPYGPATQEYARQVIGNIVQ